MDFIQDEVKSTLVSTISGDRHSKIFPKIHGAIDSKLGFNEVDDVVLG